MAQLEADLDADRLAHAYLFVGPKGVGKTTTARALFAALNCTDPRDGAACGRCPACHRAAAGRHEDFLLVEPEGEAATAQIKVEQVREVIRALSFPPLGKGVRVVVFRGAGQLNPAGSGALLKTLEEPPARNCLVLTVQDPKELLPTLVSRCRRVNFRPLAEELIAGELVRRGGTPEAAGLKAALAGGSLGAALALDEGLLAGELEQLLKYLAAPRDSLADWAFAEDWLARFRGGERIERPGIVQALDLWGLYLRDQATRAAGRPRAGLLDARAPAGLGLAAAVGGFDLVRQAQGQILANASPELTLAVLLGRLRALWGQATAGIGDAPAVCGE